MVPLVSQEENKITIAAYWILVIAVEKRGCFATQNTFTGFGFTVKTGAVRLS